MKAKPHVGCEWLKSIMQEAGLLMQYDAKA